MDRLRNLCDTDTCRSGKLNAEQFALAMHLIAERVHGREPPDKLPQHLIPLTKRQGSPKLPVSTAHNLSSVTTSSQSLLDDGLLKPQTRKAECRSGFNQGRV